jgi:enoyl-CoA hydratase/carnithine racemase
VRVLWLHRPERRNAGTLRMAVELHEAPSLIDADARLLVITGSDDVFSVGVDLGSGNVLQPGEPVADPPRSR